MKLKKVVSLALAGVLAVSMLAGCGTDKKPGSGEGETTSTGYSAELGKYVDTKLDYVTFADNAADQAALQTQVDSMTDTAVLTAKGWMKAPDEQVFKDEAKLDVVAFWNEMEDNADKNMNVTYKLGSVYVADSTQSLSQVLKTVAKELTSGDRLLTEAKTPEQGSADGLTYDYHYTVSVSVVERDVTTAIGTAGINLGSRYFVAVTITRTSTAA